MSRWKPFYAPFLITLVLLVGQLSYGLLESYAKTATAIGVSIATELILGRLLMGRWPHLASAYVTGISIGILVRSPFFWPYILDAAISITSKYAFRYRGRHLWNPSNFGICLLLLTGSHGASVLSQQWGNSIVPMMIIWTLGTLILLQVGRLHVSATYVAAFLVFAYGRHLLHGLPLEAVIGPLTGPMYQLFIFFMVTDPKTTVASKKVNAGW